MFVWGGYGNGRSVIPLSYVEQFNVQSASWQKSRQLSSQSLPAGLYGMAVAADGDRVYSFGGYSVSKLENALYCLDLSSMRCGQISTGADSPTAREYSGMVLCGRRLVLYGGWNEFTATAFDELFVFDLDTSETIK